MKSLSARPTTTGRRVAAALVAGASAVSLLGGCGFATRQQAAAVVNGHVITEADVQASYEQLQAAKLDFSQDAIVMGLVAGPLLDEAMQASGGWKPDETYAAVLATIPDPTQTTKDFVAAAALVNSQTMTPAEVTAYRKALQNADISLNPKFGTVKKVDQGPVYFTFGTAAPDWIKPQSNAAASGTTPAPAETTAP
ncbi:hypothetical protein [Intrasporangium flavum]|uniref:hypothetical protein n=1 Tax=Intrasporangium flavum TaxID=1428657 RepID=UPI001A961201|nr:hypothetical protein [Intrasporangium flavum]